MVVWRDTVVSIELMCANLASASNLDCITIDTSGLYRSALSHASDGSSPRINESRYYDDNLEICLCQSNSPYY